MSAFKDAGVATLKFVGSLVKRLVRTKQADSLVRFTKATRVEPIAMIDQRAAPLPYMGDIMQSLTSIFSGYYLQAVAVACNVGKVKTLQLLDALNPSRDASAAVGAKLANEINSVAGNRQTNISLLSMESYGQQLPFPGQTVSLEANPFGRVIKTMLHSNKHTRAEDTARTAADELNKAAQREDAKGHVHRAGEKDGAKFGSDTMKAAKESVDLSVGKLLEVTIKSDGAEATFPIAVRLIATLVAAPVLVHILGDSARDRSLRERWHLYKAGQIKFWRDLVMCQDMIDEHKKMMLKDKSGAMDEIMARRMGNMAASTITASPSVATASNIMVITKQTAKELERDIGGKLSSATIRERILKSTYVMLLAVVDTEWEQITIYHRGITLPTTVAVKELKAANKGGGPDVAEILKAYTLGMNPTV